MADEEESRADVTKAEPLEAEEDTDNREPSEAGEINEDEASKDKPTEQPASTMDSAAGEKTEKLATNTGDMTQYSWCKIYAVPQVEGGQDHYWMHFTTQQSRLDEPSEPYWIWNNETGSCDPNLHVPAGVKAEALAEASGSAPTATTDTEEYQGYNPKIHGNYDPNAPYAKWHQQKRETEQAAQAYQQAAPGQAAAPIVAGSFNRFTGAFQAGEQSTAEHHSEFNRSGRQLNAYFDVDAAANSHEGRSLKEERRTQKLSRKQIKELNEKRREKKEQKRMAFYKS